MINKPNGDDNFDISVSFAKKQKEKANGKSKLANIHIPSSSGRSIDARNLHLPTLTIVALIGFVGWIVFVVVSEKGAFESRVSNIETQVASVAKSVEKLSEIVTNQSIAGMTADNWRKNDHLIWCLQAQIINKDWTCPESCRLTNETTVTP